MCRMWWFIAVLRSFFHSSLLYTLSFHPFSPTSLPSSFTSSCHLFLGLHRRHSSPYCCWSLWWISADRTFSPRNLITMRCSTLRGTFCSLITLATPRQDWTGSNPSRKEGVGCGFTLSRSHSFCAVRLVYTQISPGHIWTTFYPDWGVFSGTRHDSAYCLVRPLISRSCPIHYSLIVQPFDTRCNVLCLLPASLNRD